MNARLARGKFIAALPGHALLPGRFAFYFFAQAKFLIPQTARSINGADLSAIYFFLDFCLSTRSTALPFGVPCANAFCLRQRRLINQPTISATSVGRPCPLWVKSRHMQCKSPCPLYPRKRPRKRTSANGRVRFAPKSRHVQCNSSCLLWANSGQRRPIQSGRLWAYRRPRLTSS